MNISLCLSLCFLTAIHCGQCLMLFSPWLPLLNGLYPQIVSLNKPSPLKVVLSGFVIAKKKKETNIIYFSLISAPIYIFSYHLLLWGLDGSCLTRTLRYIIVYYRSFRFLIQTFVMYSFFP